MWFPRVGAVSGLCLGCVWAFWSLAVSGHIWVVSGLCLGCVWAASGRCLGSVLVCLGLCLGGVTRRCLGCVWVCLGVSGLCLGCVWVCLGCVWGLWQWVRSDCDPMLPRSTALPCRLAHAVDPSSAGASNRAVFRRPCGIPLVRMRRPFPLGARRLPRGWTRQLAVRMATARDPDLALLCASTARA